MTPVPVANHWPTTDPRLSTRELDYLARLALNEPRKVIAARDGISIRRVDAIVERAMTRLGASTLIEAFTTLGWLRPGGHSS